MRLAVAAVLSACVAGAPAVLATPLDKGACDTLKIERDMLTGRGIATDMERGPEWAKSNLTTERLAEIARFIELDEQLMFRCARTAAQPGGKPKGAKDQPGKPTKDKAAADNPGDDGAAPNRAAGEKTPREKIAKESEGTAAKPGNAAPATTRTAPATAPAAAAVPPAAAAPAAKPVQPQTAQRKKKQAKPDDDLFPFFAP